MEEVNKLSNIELYRKLSLSYQPSKSAVTALTRVKYFPLAGISSSGRDTLIKELKLKHPNRFYDLITTTTRKPRINNGILEQNGREYFFISEDEFLEKIKNKQMIEWAVIHNQQLSGLDSSTFQGVEEDKYIINDIDIVGALNLIKFSNTIKPIFIVPPSFKVWQSRLVGRGEMPEMEFLNRMRSARNELSLALDEPRMYFVINDDLDRARGEIYNFIDKGIKLNQSPARGVAQEIATNLDQLLAEN